MAIKTQGKKKQRAKDQDKFEELIDHVTDDNAKELIRMMYAKLLRLEDKHK